MKTWFSTLALATPAKPTAVAQTNEVLSEIIDALEKAKKETDKDKRFELIDEAYENVLCALIYHESE